MATWGEIEDEVPDFAAKVLARFKAGANTTLATVRRDGGPRISATEVRFEDGQVNFGMIAGSVKVQDIRLDPRVALHSPTTDAADSRPEDQPGDAKLAGTLVQTKILPEGIMFRMDITEAAFIRLEEGSQLVIESWDPNRRFLRRSRPI
jgi:Pyridoxamine 5'-phosphate oxidase